MLRCQPFGAEALLSAVVCAVLCSACGDASAVEGDTPTSVVSEQGLASASVSFRSEVRRGENAFDVVLEPSHAGETVDLLAARAVMPAHGHRSATGEVSGSAPAWVVDGLNLYMTGRWHVELEARIGAENDSFVFPVDVP